MSLLNIEPGKNDCNEIRNDFKPLLRLYLDLLTDKFDQLQFEQTALDQADLSEIQLQQIYHAFKANELSQDKIDEKIIELIGTNDDTKDLFVYLYLPKHQATDCKG